MFIIYKWATYTAQCICPCFAGQNPSFCRFNHLFILKKQLDYYDYHTFQKDYHNFPSFSPENHDFPSFSPEKNARSFPVSPKSASGCRRNRPRQTPSKRCLQRQCRRRRGETVANLIGTVMAMANSYNWLFLWDEKHSINGVTC